MQESFCRSIFGYCFPLDERRVSRLYQISGCTFDFDDGRTRSVWEEMSWGERQAFPLFAVEKYGMVADRKEPDLSSRNDAFRRLSEMYLKRKQWPQWVLPLFCQL